jgi:hypothetical protein
MVLDQKTHKAEKGNVLFLILIAVALFAALSYAVTQSTRGGGEGATSETNLVNSAQITQYPSTIRTAVIRMIINGIDYQDLEFNAPADFGDCSLSNANCVFHPQGGGATHQKAPANVMEDGETGDWFFNLEFEVDEIGTSATGAIEGNELIAFLPGIKESLCDRINEELGIDPADDVTNAATLAGGAAGDYDLNMEDDYSLPATEVILGTSAGTATLGLLGQPFGCMKDAGGDNVYYHVVVEK